MRRTVDQIAGELARANLDVEAAESDAGQAARDAAEAGHALGLATKERDRLRLELREAVRAAGAWPDPGRDVAP